MKSNKWQFSTIISMMIVMVLTTVSCSKTEREPEPGPEERPSEEDKLILPEGTTRINPGFYYSKFAPMPLPSTLKYIGAEAFFACFNDFVVIPEGVEEIGERAFMKGSYPMNLIGRLKWLYLPKSLKSVGGLAFKGIYGDLAYHDNPKVVFASETPPKGFIDAVYYDIIPINGSNRVTLSYVPESALDAYIQTRESYIKKCCTDDNDALAEIIRNDIPIYSYRPVSIEITHGTGDHIYHYSYQPTNDNQGEIIQVRWDTLNHSIVEFSDNGVLYPPNKVGKTFIQCIVSTTASDGTDIDFYFFQPIEITQDMITS